MSEKSEKDAARRKIKKAGKEAAEKEKSEHKDHSAGNRKVQSSRTRRPASEPKKQGTTEGRK